MKAAIERHTGGRAYGRLRDEIFALACDIETTDRLVEYLRSAPPMRSIKDTIALCHDALLAPPAEPIPESKLWERPDDSDAAPPPPDLAAWLNKPDTVTPTCETDGGGAQ